MIDEKKILIENLLKNGYIQSEKVKKAMETVEREEFIPKNMKKYAYLDRPLPLSKGQTISAPHMVAFICEKLEIKDGMNILEIGTGFGYNAAVISEVMNKKGHVYSIERIESLAKTAINNLKRNGYEKSVDVIIGDGTLGYEKGGPYDRIYGTAGNPYVPESLKKQLKVGGRLLIPIGDKSDFQDLICIFKESENKFIEKSLGEVVFVPMIGKYGWSEK
ncbi:Protein-L-isoaspartate O-methyltransferase [bioreactor metagenome]|uniref:protein-L-isoaspartate(D-aspartate) O-methyltransferase n=1 Tax=bioreactor metagenome TaxID=1076179 RepID=A0A644VA50_9ZZZZ|nr:protein-L-isoaspartate(D-aspartate) O-methyltransferase [Methanobrevibacter sp.]MEA4957347.1 protein-L-isoaspartate(D-aspartate) O-methyltransferase [Methanobrevibacter sp.]